VMVILAGGAVWRQRTVHREATLQSLSIGGDGAMLVVKREDGSRWLIGPRSERGSKGHYVIVIPE